MPQRNNQLLGYNRAIMQRFYSFIIAFHLTVFSLMAEAKVDPPNYDFSLNKFQLFMPGSLLTEIEKKYKFKEVIFKNGPFVTYKFYIEHIRYRFALLAQFKDGKVVDFYARLPQYFLHNIFHQSLINRLGPQDKYKKVDEHAVYIWNNKNNLKHIYSGACTITCFPIFYAVKPVTKNNNNYKAVVDRVLSSEQSFTTTLSPKK